MDVCLRLLVFVESNSLRCEKGKDDILATLTYSGTATGYGSRLCEKDTEMAVVKSREGQILILGDYRKVNRKLRAMKFSNESYHSQRHSPCCH